MLYLLILFFLLFCMAFWKVSRRQGQVVLHQFDQYETLPLRGFLAIAVWLTHLCPYLVKDVPYLTDFCLWGPPSVACFFLLSGYGLAVSYEKKGASYLDGFFRKRLMRLLLPLLIMTIIYQGWKMWRGMFDVVSMINEPSPMSWFIYALLIWYVIFYVCYRYFAGTKRLLVLWTLTILYLSITISQGMGYYWMSILPMPLIMTLVPHESKIKRFIQEHAYPVLIVFMVLTMAVLIYASLGQYGMKLPVWGPPVYTILPFSVLILTYFLGGWKCRFFNFLGKISYEFYIVHGMIVMLTGHVLWIEMNGSLNACIAIIVSFLIILLSSTLLYFFVSLLDRTK